MKNMVLLLLLTNLFGCQSKQSEKIEMQPFNIDQVKAHILEMNKSYSKRFVTEDSAFYIERYCSDAEVYCPGMPAIKGRNAVRDFFYGNGSNNEAAIELPPSRIYGKEELVVEEGTYNFPDGKGGSIDQGKFIAVWKQEWGKWKLYREIWNSDIPPKKNK